MLKKPTDFWQALDTLVSESEIVIDRPKGSAHPHYADLIYPLDYGYLKGTAAMDGDGIDIWRGSKPSEEIDAIICVIDLAKRDSEIKILIGCTKEEEEMVCRVHNETEYMKGILIQRSKELFCTQHYRLAEVQEKDLAEILRIYNSNKTFLENHIGVEKVDEKWCLQEYHDMKDSGFLRCGIVDIKSGIIVGFADFSLLEEAYLSLIMIHGSFKRSGIGKEVLKGFERYAENQGCKRIRIDVVTGYDDSSLKFWLRNGFAAKEEITLSWDKKKFPALKMIKVLA